MQDFEKLGQFYLGKEYDVGRRRGHAGPMLLYDSKDLTTHAVCVGMTGSGKTGLGIALLEEAAIDGIPVIAIDPKGDLGNLLLAFPELRPEDFLPWVDPDEAGRKGLTREEFAAKTAEIWREGLAAWGEDGARIARFRDAVDLAIYTPGSSAGLPMTVLRSFDAPPPGLAEQPEAYRQRIASAVSGLLALLGVNADPMSSREHILLSNVLDHAWRAGHNLDMAGLIHAVQSPPFQKVGVLDLETFFPAKDRFALAMKLNNLLASPGFAAWLEGEPLDVGGLLSTRAGKPRLSIVSIAHLSDAERMFFVTILLNEVLAWARSQPGTSSLRAILYMDEIFGYFPATANPPSKLPMLTLLKQARAYGLGVVLATQNPVDLDYKGLSNAGTWFIGRLQTQRDKDRVLEGLEGASTASGHAFDRPEMDRVLSALGQRVFVMNNVHDDRPVVFQTRWTLSYLRGPMTREQIQSLMAARKQALARPARRRAGGPSRAAVLAAATDSPSAASARPRRWRRPGPGRWCRRTCRCSSSRGGHGSSPASRSCTVRRSWAWPGCITPTRRRASTTGRRWPCSSRWARRCRRSPGPGACRSTTASPSWTRPPRPAPLRALAVRAGAGQVLRRLDEVAEELPLSRADAGPVDLPRGQGSLAADGGGAGVPAAGGPGVARGARPGGRGAAGEVRAEDVGAGGPDPTRPRAAGARAGPGEQIDLGRDGRPGQHGPGRALRPQGALQDQRDPRRLGRQGRRPGRAAARRRRLGRGLARSPATQVRRRSTRSSARRWASSTRRCAPRPWRSRRLPIRPRKADITVEQVVLAWTPWKVGAHGRPEPAYRE